MSFSLLFVALTLIMATASFYLVETPLRIQRTNIKQALYYILFALSVFGTSKSIAKVNQALSPPPLPIEYQRYADPKTICHGQIVGDCLKGDLKSSKEVLVLGDSHAAMLNLFFDQLGKEHGFKARIITASSCITIPEFDYQRLPEWAQSACRNQIKEAQIYIQQAKTIFLAGMWSWQFKGEKFQLVIVNFLENAAPNARKYILSQVPLLNQNPMREQRFNVLGLKHVVGRDESYILTNNVLEKISKNYSDVIFVKLDKLELFDMAPVYEKSLSYYDESHMNEKGVLKYSEQASGIFKFLLKGKQQSEATE